MEYSIEIENLKCGGCAATIIKGISSIEGVEDVKVEVDESTVELITNKDVLNEVKVKLSKMGYPEVGDVNTALHKAKSYVSCAVG